MTSIDWRHWLKRLDPVFKLQFLVAIAIFTYFALWPKPADLGGDQDLLLHFVGNLVFFLSARLAMLQFKSHWFVLGFVLIYGSAVEAAQYLVPGRLFDMRDLLANSLGVLGGLGVALLVGYLVRRYIGRDENSSQP